MDTFLGIFYDAAVPRTGPAGRNSKVASIKMKGENRVAEDSFDRARKAFFGNGKNTAGPNVTPVEFPTPPNEPIQSKDGRAGAAAWNEDLRTRA
jgi:hypothetical protein